MNLPDHFFLTHVDVHQGTNGIAVTLLRALVGPGAWLAVVSGRPVALAALQPKGDVVFPGKLVLEVIGTIVEVVGDDVEPAGATKVGGGGAARAARCFL